MAGSIKVAARVRPSLPGKDDEADNCMAVTGVGGFCRELTVTLPPLAGQVLNGQPSETRFEFDRVFGPKSTQLEVFEHCGLPVLDALLKLNKYVSESGNMGLIYMVLILIVATLTFVPITIVRASEASAKKSPK